LAKLIDSGLRRALAQLGIGDIARHPDGLPTRGNEIHGLRLGLGRVQIGYDDPRAPRGKPRAGHRANATGPTENQDYFVYLVLHGWKIRA
jgi:hypothetical protein